MLNNIYDSDSLKCFVRSQAFVLKELDTTHNEFFTDEIETLSSVDFVIQGEAHIVWPNREGEGFTLSEVHSSLIKLGHSENGISISYPATASILAFLVEKNKDEGFLCFMEKDSTGRVYEININSEKDSKLIVTFTGIQKKWTCVTYNKSAPLQPYWNAQNKQKILITKQFQLGLIGPDGRTNVPEDKGFSIIPEIAAQLTPVYGSQNGIIHIFGYGQGHDRMYPDYTPSSLLGGPEVLKKAISETQSLGFVTSFYLNGRIIDKEALVVFPELEEAILKDASGENIIEVYQGRTFMVMDPSSLLWQNCLIHRASILAECGAYAVQLDQLGGRAAAKNKGEIWGEGYNRIIEEIHKLGLKVWIQGISDFYDADWFEMTYRDLNILEGGILRGGNPFGETDLSLVDLFLGDKTFLVTESKKVKIQNPGRYHLIIDHPDFKGQLPLYGRKYKDLLINVEAALR